MPGSPRPDRAARPEARAPGAALPWVTLHSAVLLFGLAGLFGKWLALPPVLIVLGRVLVASAAFALWLRGRERCPWPTLLWWRGVPDRGLLLLCGGLMAFHWVAFFQAIQVSTVAIGLLGYATAPLFTALLEPWLLRERFSGRTAAAALLTLAGVALIAPRWDWAESALRGLAWGVAAGASFALLALANRHLRRRLGAARLAFHQDAAAALALLPLLPWHAAPLGLRELALLLLLGVACTALAHGLFAQALGRVRAGAAVVTSALEPVYGIALAWLLLGEQPAARTLGGGVLILAAVLAVSLRARATPPDAA